MQSHDGTLTPVDAADKSQLAKVFNVDFPDAQQPLVRVGDTFRIRGCHFQVSDLSSTGLRAVGISKDLYYASRHLPPGVPKSILKKMRKLRKQ